MIDFEKEESRLALPAVRITVLGVGGGGCNTINSLLPAWYEAVTCVAVNTDLKALETSKAAHKIQIGVKSTKGLGSGANPDLGKRAAEEDLPEIMELVRNSDIVFLTGGLGGGTGSGALPIIARALKERDLLSVAVVTKPFSFEGKRRMRVAEEAEILLRKEVDTLITIPNEKLLELADKKLSLVHAFDMVNEVISQFVKSIADIIARPGYINVDFADLKAIMKGKGMAVMGTGKASGERRALCAAQQAVASPLLDNVSIKGAQSVLLNVTGSSNLGLLEVSEAASLIMEQAHPDAQIILGSVIDEEMGDEVSVTVIATGFVAQAAKVVIEEKPLQQQPAAVCYDMQEVKSVAVEVPVQAVCEESVTCTETIDEKEEAPIFSMRHPLQDLLMQEKEKLAAEAVKEQAAATESAPASAQQVAADKQKDLEIPTLLRKMVQEKRQQQKN